VWNAIYVPSISSFLVDYRFTNRLYPDRLRFRSGRVSADLTVERLGELFGADYCFGRGYQPTHVL
jgi:hypothetical protein